MCRVLELVVTARGHEVEVTDAHAVLYAPSGRLLASATADDKEACERFVAALKAAAACKPSSSAAYIAAEPEDDDHRALRRARACRAEEE
jgi:hypothetical protein